MHSKYVTLWLQHLSTVAISVSYIFSMHRLIDKPHVCDLLQKPFIANRLDRVAAITIFVGCWLSGWSWHVSVRFNWGVDWWRSCYDFEAVEVPLPVRQPGAPSLALRQPSTVSVWNS